MIEETVETEPTSLGDYLRAARQNLGLDISVIAEKTKISHKNLLAIEDDDYSVLPAEAFTRGFYRLYAGILFLNPEEILKKYDAEKTTRPKKITLSVPSYRQQGREVSSMAERPSLLPFSSIGLVIFMLLFFGAFLCWYFSWNPASFLSQKLRSLQQSEDRIEQAQLQPKTPVFSLPSSSVTQQYSGGFVTEGKTGSREAILLRHPGERVGWS